LFFQSLAEHFHELVPAMLLERRLLFGGEFLLEFLYKPFKRNVLALGVERGHLAVKRCKGAIVAIEQGFVLHQCHARRVVEIIYGRLHDVGAQRFQQGQVFLHGNGQAAAAQVIKEIKQHGVDSAKVRVQLRRAARAMAPRRSSSVRSCSFLSRAPASLGRSPSAPPISSAGTDSATSNCNQSRNSDVDGFFFRPGTSRSVKKVSSAERTTSSRMPGKCTSTMACRVSRSGKAM